MLKQKSGNVVTISASLADQPVAGIHASVSMMTKGRPEYRNPKSRNRIRKRRYPLQRCSPGVVDSPLHKEDPRDSLKMFQPMGTIVEIKDIVDAGLYLARAGQVTEEIIHVDGGSHAGRW